MDEFRFIQVGTLVNVVQNVAGSVSGDTVTIEILRLSDGYTWNFTTLVFEDADNTGSMIFISGTKWYKTFTPPTANTYIATITFGASVSVQQFEAVGSPAPSAYAGAGLISEADLELITQTAFATDYANTLIYAASDFIAKYTKRVLSSATYTSEKYDGNGSYYLYLKQYPITNIASFYRWDTISNVASKTYTINTDYLYDANRGWINLREGFQYGIQNYQITYTAGYSTLPYDIRQACALYCMWLHTTKDKAGFASESMGDYSYNMADLSGQKTIGGITVPPDILSLLAKYVRVDII